MGGGRVAEERNASFGLFWFQAGLGLFPGVSEWKQARWAPTGLDSGSATQLLRTLPLAFRAKTEWGGSFLAWREGLRPQEAGFGSMGWGEGQGEYKPHFYLTDGIRSTGVYRGSFRISSLRTFTAKS